MATLAVGGGVMGGGALHKATYCSNTLITAPTACFSISIIVFYGNERGSRVKLIEIPGKNYILVLPLKLKQQVGVFFFLSLSDLIEYAEHN